METKTDKPLVILVSGEGRILTFNRECETVTGYTYSEVVGKNLIEFLVPTEWQERVLNRFASSTPTELRMPHSNPWKTKSGELRIIEWICSALPDKAGQMVLGVGHVRG